MADALTLSPTVLLGAYARGIFPMAEGRADDKLHWIDPRRRGIIPINGFHISRSLARCIRSGQFSVSFDTDFDGVVQGCSDRAETWINGPLYDLYRKLFATGHAHSVEVTTGGVLAGGVFGISIGAAFFGESMFSRHRDASKVALAYLIHRLRKAGYQLFDTQFLTPHLKTLGGIEISRSEYHERLRTAVSAHADFARAGVPTADQVLEQRKTQTS